MRESKKQNKSLPAKESLFKKIKDFFKGLFGKKENVEVEGQNYATLDYQKVQKDAVKEIKETVKTANNISIQRDLEYERAMRICQDKKELMKMSIERLEALNNYLKNKITESEKILNQEK